MLNLSSIDLSNQFKGTLYCLIGILVLTPDSLLVRHVSNIPDFTVMFYRFGIFTFTIAVVFIYKEKWNAFQKLKEIGYLGLLAGLVWGGSNFLITYAFQTTAIANVLVINASNPMFSALFSWLMLREHIPWRTIIAGLICFGAIILIFSGEIGKNGSNLVGVVCALGAAISIGLYFTLLRIASQYDGVEPDMMPCNFIAGLFVMLVSLCLSPNLLDVTAESFIFLSIQGVIVLPISFILLTIGPSLISASEVSLYTLLETILGPIWVWLGGYEAPPFYSIYGGIILILALTVHSLLSLRTEPYMNEIKSMQSIVTDDPVNSSDVGLEIDTNELHEIEPKANFNIIEFHDDSNDDVRDV
eukprot:gene8812-11899_t